MEVNGYTVREYGIDTLDDETGVSCWIPCEIGKEFAICVTIPERDLERMSHKVRVRLDGTDALIRGNIFQQNTPVPTRCFSDQWVDVARTCTRAFQFGSLQLTGKCPNWAAPNATSSTGPAPPLAKAQPRMSVRALIRHSFLKWDKRANAGQRDIDKCLQSLARILSSNLPSAMPTKRKNKNPPKPKFDPDRKPCKPEYPPAAKVWRSAEEYSDWQDRCAELRSKWRKTWRSGRRCTGAVRTGMVGIRTRISVRTRPMALTIRDGDPTQHTRYLMITDLAPTIPGCPARS
ncbi:hypothetical protein FA13DRAFT_1716747 [Coprinellus micaceus]|uniref:Uncharacterized protein n=1 Tax=Coprinellus micaceus TaxID=71717 RepID=A0A4Y7SJ08_COPMI|nr:hypothetical protein FA13DRAFT_1716747 [Coprinellus micaceus]